MRLQTLDDNTVTIPNNKFLNDSTSCGNHRQLDMQVVMDFLIGIDQGRASTCDRLGGHRSVEQPTPATTVLTQANTARDVAS